MVVLKKVKGSTLMETLIASVLIIIVFMVASTILNNVFYNSIKNNTQPIENHINRLEYLFSRNNLNIPYYDSFQNWNITIEKYREYNSIFIETEAINKDTQKTITKKYFEVE